MTLPYHIMRSVVHHSKIRSRLAAMGHSRRGQAASKPGYVRDAAESGSKFRALAGSATDVIQAPKLEPQIMS